MISPMTAPKLRIWLFQLLMRSKRISQSGFTLIELLISIIISGIIVSGLLYIVVEALQIDRREVALNQVQQDMQRALEYMAADVKEAVFVYADPMSIIDSAGNDGITDLPAGSTPALALWRIDPIPDDFECPEGSDEQICQQVITRRAFYTLIIYALIENDADSIWQGDARLVRYSLPRFTQASLETGFAERTGYRSPGSQIQSFLNWSRADDTDGTEGLRAVLVDQLAEFEPVDLTTLNLSDENENICADPDLVGSTDYLPSPVTDASSFIACVRDPGDDNSNLNPNQDVYLFLQGDAVASQEFINPLSDASRLPTLSTRVMARGILNRAPATR
jgi:prepilin-type N-terminal cleavage/methylation domain-containing protein